MEIIFRISIAFSLLATVLARDFLPEQYFRDSNYLLERSQSAVTGNSDSFEKVVKFYSFLRISEYSIILSAFQWMIFAALLFGCLKFCQKKDKIIYFVSIFYFLLIPFYGSMLTKEILVALFLILTHFFARKLEIPSRFEWLVYIPFLLAIGISIRNYYFLILACYIVLHFSFSALKLWRFFFILLIIPTLSTFEYATQKISNNFGSNIFQIRMEVVDSLPIKPRTTIMQSAYSENFFENFVNYVKVLLQMFFPISIAQGSLYNFITFVPIIVITLLICRVFILISGPIPVTPEISLFLAYLIVATIFEPDLGSFLRHSFPYLPILILGLNGQNILNVKGFGK